MKKSSKSYFPLIASLGLLAQPGLATSLIVDFGDLSLTIPPAQAYNGPGGGVYYNGSDLAGGFTSGGLHFANDYNADWSAWNGFAYSTTSDTVTGDFSNQYSAYSGSAFTGAVHAVSFVSGTAVATLPSAWNTPLSVQITNVTYAALTMLDGDMFSKKFGGPDGTDPDWFRLTITGLDSAANVTGSVDFYLADFRSPDANDHYILDEWAEVDLTPLGSGVNQLSFSLSSSDVGDWGMNTPAYFAMDRLVLIPEPATTAMWLAVAGLIWVLRRHRRY